ncbi:MAG TPA: gfo/Idh/MocA family oxidoreductase, partial [Bacteroidales bacterium]|nr:gfo/Idh/MocA family oxidoreductase [Bacteroidales bacterium]
LITGGRPDSVNLLIPDRGKEELRSGLPEKTIPRVEGGPQQEWLRAIKGKGPAPGSAFDYSADLTEMVLLGQMAQRFNARLEYDSVNMRITNNHDVDKYLHEPARPGWEY